jgi:hypothetical protein
MIHMTYLGREVEPQVAVVRQTVLDEQGNFAGQAQLDGVGQTAGLAEVCEVLQGEGKGDGLGEVDLDGVLGLVYSAVLPELDRSRANVTLAGELDTLLCALD